MASIEDFAEEIERVKAESFDSLNGDYRRTFNTPNGQRVLRDILRDLHFLEIAKSENSVVLQGYAVVLLRKLGVLGRDAVTSDIDRFLTGANPYRPDPGEDS